MTEPNDFQRFMHESLSGETQVPELKTPKAIADYMSKATSERNWNDRCNEIKRQNNGYPDFWYETIISSGLAGRTLLRAKSSN